MPSRWAVIIDDSNVVVNTFGFLWQILQALELGLKNGRSPTTAEYDLKNLDLGSS